MNYLSTLFDKLKLYPGINHHKSKFEIESVKKILFLPSVILFFVSL